MSAINTVITPNNDVKDEQSLIEKNIQKIIIEIQKYNRVNIIDIGCGNGVPVLEIIERLKQDKKEVIYTAVDISKEMIEIALSEVSKKNPNVLIKSILLDLEYANLSEYLLTSSSSDTVNLLLLLGGTLGNYNKDKSIVRILRESMTSNDYLLIGNALVNENSNIYPYEANSYHYTRTTWIPDLLGLNGHYVENRINEVNVSKSQEYREIRFSSNITTSVTVNEVEYPLSFNEGDTILVYQFFWYGEAELVNTVIQHNFSIVHFTTNKERTYGLMFVSPTK